MADAGGGYISRTKKLDIFFIGIHDILEAISVGWSAGDALEKWFSRDKDYPTTMYKVKGTILIPVGVGWGVYQELDSTEVNISPNSLDGITLEKLNQLIRDNHKIYLNDKLKYDNRDF